MTITVEEKLIMKRVGVYFLAVVMAYLLAVIFISICNMGFLSDMAVSLPPLSKQLSVIGQDMLGMAPMLLLLVSIALLLAWLFTGQILGRILRTNVWFYALAGFTGMVAIHLIPYSIFGISLVAATRTFSGLALQGIAGALAGWFFYQFAFEANNDR